MRSRWMIRYQLVFGAASFAVVLAIGLGIAFFPGELTWWLPGALLVAAPGFVAAYVTARRTRA